MAHPLQSLAAMHGASRLSVLVLVAGSALSGCIVVDSVLTVDCVEHIHQSTELATPNDDTALQFKIDRCQLDTDACTELCTLTLQRAGVGDPVSGCNVEFSSAKVAVHVTFDQATNAPGCSSRGISEPGSATPTVGGGK